VFFALDAMAARVAEPDRARHRFDCAGHLPAILKRLIAAGVIVQWLDWRACRGDSSLTPSVPMTPGGGLIGAISNHHLALSSFSGEKPAKKAAREPKPPRKRGRFAMGEQRGPRP